MNRILLVAPHWHKRHSFIARHAECIKKELVGIVTNHTPPDPVTYNCPVMSLSEPPISIWEKIVRRFHGYPRDRNVHRKRRFSKILRQYVPDIILFEFATMSAHFAETCVKYNMPYVIHYHGYDYSIAYRDNIYKSKFLQNSIKAQYNIANSHWTRDRLIELGIKEESIRMKYMGVPIPTKRCTLPKNAPLRIVHLGSFFEKKAPLNTIKAFEWATENGLEATMKMAGDGTLKTDCKKYVHNKGISNITFLETVPNNKAIDLIRSSHLLTQHSILTNSFEQESFGVAIAEAMAQARAVVVSEHGPFPELVINGKTGILFPEHDWKAQGRAFLELDNDREKLKQYGLAGYERVRENFSLEKECNELRNILGLHI